MQPYKCLSARESAWTKHAVWLCAWAHTIAVYGQLYGYVYGCMFEHVYIVCIGSCWCHSNSETVCCRVNLNSTSNCAYTHLYTHLYKYLYTRLYTLNTRVLTCTHTRTLHMPIHAHVHPYMHLYMHLCPIYHRTCILAL